MPDEAPSLPAPSGRDETRLEQLDRNWTDLLQELRVVQTGVQLLTGFLLTLPFQSRFSELTRSQQNVYLVTVACSVTATAVLIAPVIVHRLLFRRHARASTVVAAHRLSILGAFLLACAITSAMLLIVDVLRGPTAGIVAAVVTGVVVFGLWVVLPLRLRFRADAEADEHRTPHA